LGELKGQPGVFPWWLEDDHSSSILGVGKHCGQLSLGGMLFFQFFPYYNKKAKNWEHETTHDFLQETLSHVTGL
jgi:hypothetical protein